MPKLHTCHCDRHNGNQRVAGGKVWGDGNMDMFQKHGNHVTKKTTALSSICPCVTPRGENVCHSMK